LETKIGNTEVTPQAIGPIAKSPLKSDGPRTSGAIHGPSGLKFLPSEKVNAIADWKISSHTMTSVTRAMNGRWGLEFKP
jgi:hypothetical protein